MRISLFSDCVYILLLGLLFLYSLFSIALRIHFSLDRPFPIQNDLQSLEMEPYCQRPSHFSFAPSEKKNLPRFYFSFALLSPSNFLVIIAFSFIFFVLNFFNHIFVLVTSFLFFFFVCFRLITAIFVCYIVLFMYEPFLKATKDRKLYRSLIAHVLKENGT